MDKKITLSRYSNTYYDADGYKIACCNIASMLGAGLPEELKISCRSKNPKKKGWKKVNIQGQEDSDYFDVTISGKEHTNVYFYANLRGLVGVDYFSNNSKTLYVKIG